MNENDLFKRNIGTFQDFNRDKLKYKILPQFIEFIQNNRVQFYYVECLPKHLENIGCCVFKSFGNYFILLIESELQKISNKTKTPINFVANIAIIHEISHIVSDAIGKFDDEQYVWNLGETMIKNASIPQYCYEKVRKYLSK
ncbi:hypothetical protein [Nostoc sp. FACHB-190]|uniref:hypothetical protein n=1 Tax=Nostoc sp. FACHB-190 TaxID=2692838 RepID=UPI001689B999|nr:hypothetical protein [Nostoc sp. FACHB-190]MBD2303621.1 hypothetical protein [Nostoc sp. FACHB-190]